MKQYKLRADAVPVLRKKMRRVFIPLIVVAVAIGLGSALLNSTWHASSVYALIISLSVTGILVFRSVSRAMKRQEEQLNSYTLTIANTLIGREQANTPSIVIYHQEVRSIEKTKTGRFTVKGKDSTDIIYIPAEIDDPAGLELALSAIYPITPSKTSPRTATRIVLSFIPFIAFLVAVTASNKVVVVVAGMFYLSLTAWNLYEAQRSKNIDRQTKRNLWRSVVMMVFVVLIIAMKIFV